MIEPSINSLLKKVDSRYTLVIETAKRARQIAAGEKPLVDCKSENPVTIAATEIDQGKITYVKTKSGLK